jgi:TolA-binding protein
MMKHSLTTVVLSIVVAGMGSALGPRPAAAADKETLQMMADIRMLQEQLQQTQLLIGSLAEAVKSVDTRLTQKVDDQADALRRAFADQKLGLDALSADVRVLREKVDDSSVRLGSVTQEIDALRQTVVSLTYAPPPPALPLDGGAEAAASGASGVGAGPAMSLPPPAPAASAAGASPQRMWDSAMADYSAGDLDLAILGFESYVRSFPTSERADDAQVYICASYSLQGALDRAVEACDLAIRTYPNGDAVPDAYYRKGLAERSLQRLDEARRAFEFVVRTYPDSPAAMLSHQRLEEMQRP